MRNMTTKENTLHSAMEIGLHTLPWSFTPRSHSCCQSSKLALSTHFSTSTPTYALYDWKSKSAIRRFTQHWTPRQLGSNVQTSCPDLGIPMVNCGHPKVAMKSNLKLCFKVECKLGNYFFYYYFYHFSNST